MRHATPCIRPATLAATHPKLKGSKQLNQYNASVMKVVDFCLITAHVFKNHSVVELYTHALCTCYQL